jgi:hypothetical protein
MKRFFRRNMLMDEYFIGFFVRMNRIDAMPIIKKAIERGGSHIDEYRCGETERGGNYMYRLESP